MATSAILMGLDKLKNSQGAKDYEEAGLNKYSTISVEQGKNLNQAMSELRGIGKRVGPDRSQASSMDFLANQINPALAQNYQSMALPAMQSSMGGGFWGSSKGAAADMAQSNLSANMSQIGGKQNYLDEQARQALSEGRITRKLQGLQGMANTATGGTFDTVKQKGTLDKLAEATGAVAGGMAAAKQLFGTTSGGK